VLLREQKVDEATAAAGVGNCIKFENHVEYCR
jgi:hypothetical protein